MTEETENQASKLFCYYYSTDQLPFKEVFTLLPIDRLPYGFHSVAPDGSIKSPKWDYSVQKWVENDGKAQAQLIGQLQEQVGSLQTNNKNLDENNQKTNVTLETMEKQNAQMLAMLSALLAPKPTNQPASSNSKSKVTDENSESASDEPVSSSATNNATKGSAE